MPSAVSKQIIVIFSTVAYGIFKMAARKRFLGTHVIMLTLLFVSLKYVYTILIATLIPFFSKIGLQTAKVSIMKAFETKSFCRLQVKAFSNLNLAN